MRTEDRLSSLPETSKHAGTQIGDGAGIAMFMPHPSSLRANAVWITAANWAEGAARRWGQSWTMIPGELLSPAQVRALANRPAVAPRDSAVRRWIPTVARTALKDMRLLAHRRNVSRTYPTGGLDTQQIAFVWQHHDLFLRTGTTFARRHGLPLVQFVDAPVVWESRRWGVRRPGWGSLLAARGEVPQLRAADIVACVSAEVAEAVVANGVAEHRVVVTPCTADRARFHPGVPRHLVRRRWGITDEQFVVGWTGSFRPFHDLGQLLVAFRTLATVVPQARLLLVGEGAQRPVMQAEIERHGIGPQTILTGQVPHDEIPAHVRAMDAAVVTAATPDFHYSPLKLREYLLCAVPVVAPSVGQIREMLRDGQDALLYPVGNVTGLTSALLDLAQDSRRRDALGRAGYASETRRGGIAVQLDLVVERLRATAAIRR